MIAYFLRIARAFQRDGIDLDETENAVLDGDPSQTISMRCAIAARRGALWAHLACIALNLVQPGHCRKQIAGVPMAWWNYGLACFWLLAIPSALIGAIMWAL